jgi:membrane glycosyltransferase
MKDVGKRALRTFAQAFVAILVVLLIPWLMQIITAIATNPGGDIDIDLSVIGRILLAGLMSGVVALISFAQNIFEDKAGVNVLPK